MIRIQINGAQDLPVPTKKERKTTIFCFCSSSCTYFFDSYKNKENTRNPVWNASFEVDLYRVSYLKFKLYSSRLFTRKIFLGESSIDFSTFLSQPPGDKLLKQPYGSVRYEFPLTLCYSPNAYLSLSFLYIPKFYRPIQFKDLSNPIIHVWATFTPDFSRIENNIEIGLVQTCIDKDKNIGYFYDLNDLHSWESVGFSSNKNVVLGQTGFTPIRTFLLDRIKNKYTFFVIDTPNDYSGTVTLNFVAEREGKTVFVDGDVLFSPKKSKDLIGTIKTVDIRVEPKKKYLVPLYLFYMKKIFKKSFELNQFQLITTIKNDSKSDITEQLYSEIPFNSSIIEVAQAEIDDLRNANLKKALVLPSSGKVNIQKVMQEFNLQITTKLRVYINGSTTVSSGNSSYVNYWEPYFIIYNRTTHKICPEISKRLIKKPLYHFRGTFEKSDIPFDWHTYIDLNLDEIGINKVIVLNVVCLSNLFSASPPGAFHITHIDSNSKETLLFTNTIYADSCKTNATSFMRIEFIEDSWNITQMRYAFSKTKKLNYVINALFDNNWVMPEILTNKIKSPDSSDDEFLLDDIEATV